MVHNLKIQKILNKAWDMAKKYGVQEKTLSTPKGQDYREQKHRDQW